MNELKFHQIPGSFNANRVPIVAFRAKIPGGWLVRASMSADSGIAFVPDPDHLWDGGSLP